MNDASALSRLPQRTLAGEPDRLWACDAGAQFPVGGGAMRRSVAKMRGLTMLELLLVVMIVGVLAVVSVATYSNYRDKASNSQAATVKDKGEFRKDKNIVPINSDYDLYSMGKDGKSSPPLTAMPSRDDIVRANNGRFIGLAADYDP